MPDTSKISIALLARAITLACIAMVGGCAKRQSEYAAEIYLLPSQGVHAVYFVQSTDGTRCAVHGRGGISCDWHRPTEGVER